MEIILNTIRLKTGLFQGRAIRNLVLNFLQICFPSFYDFRIITSKIARKRKVYYSKRNDSNYLKNKMLGRYLLFAKTKERLRPDEETNLPR